ncbi:MAG TPA: hypothetical protein VH437_06035 [Terriglobales bacterium]
MLTPRMRESISTVLVLFWILPGILLLYILGGVILGHADHHLGLGLIQTVGRTGLLFTLLPAICGTAAILLLFRNRQLGARLLLVYCLFWFLDFLGSMIRNWSDILMSGSIFNGPILLRIGVGLLLACFLGGFLLCALWAWRRSGLRMN